MSPRPARGVAGLLPAALLAACITPPSERLPRLPDELPPRAEIADVPFHAQRTRECGPASLASVLEWSGSSAGPDQLVSEVFVPAREGSLQVGLLAAARRHGRLTFRVRDLAELFAEVASGASCSGCAPASRMARANG